MGVSSFERERERLQFAGLEREIERERFEVGFRERKRKRYIWVGFRKRDIWG